jgi:hypothetical protein
MDLDQLAEAVGHDLFTRACRHALTHAEGYGTHPDRWKEADADELEQVPHELSHLVEDDIDLAFALYRAMPCYGNLMYIGHWGISPAFWAHMRALSDDSDPRRADPAMYWLWCEAFEDKTEVSAAAWHEMTRGAGELRLRRLLRVSGPVPWAAKAPLLETLAPQLEWRASVRAALEAADTDYFGRQDKAAARRLMDEIDRRSLD